MEKVIRFILLPVLLFIFGFALSQWFYGEAYVSTIQVHHEKALSKEFFDGPLAQGKVLRGEVVAAYDNFGTLKLRIRTYNRINYDKIRFRLREKGASSWDVENAYIVDVFPDKLLYGFGFLPIQYSRGKTYEFEFWSENGTRGDSIGFRDGYHSMASQYVFRRDSIFKNPQLLRFFVRAKSHSLLNDPYFLLYGAIFMAPLFLYLAFTFIKKRYMLYGVEIAIFVYMGAIYIFLPVTIHQDTIIYIFILGIFTIIMNMYSNTLYRMLREKRFTSSHAFAIAIGLLVLLEVNIFLGNNLESTRTATGIFYCIFLALIIATSELLMENKKRR